MDTKFEINFTNSFYEDNLKEKIPLKNIEEIEIKDNQKISINSQNLLLTSYSDRRRSSDSTSISISQTENLSQTSESSLTNQNTNNSKIINNGITKKDSVEEEQIDYFFGIEKYFYKIMPQKFCDYKKSKNYLPKRNLKELEKQKEEKEEVNDIKTQENNIINNNIFLIIYFFQYVEMQYYIIIYYTSIILILISIAMKQILLRKRRKMGKKIMIK